MKTAIYVALVVFVLAALVYLIEIKSQKIREYQALVSQYEKENQHLAEQYRELEAQNITLVQKESELKRSILELSARIEEQRKKIYALESARPTTPPGCEEVVEHYLAEIQAWKERFSLAEKQLSEYQEITSNLKLQLTIKDAQINLLKKQLENQEAVSRLLNEINRQLSKEKALTSAKNKIILGGAVVLAGYLTYKALR